VSDPSIVLTGVDASTFTPGHYLEINFARGVASGFGGIYGILIVANKLSSGTATADTKVYTPDGDVPCATEDDVATLGGNGSEAHRVWRRVSRALQGVNTIPIRVLFVTQSVGAQAAITITLATNAAVACTLRIWCTDQFVEVPIASGDTPSTVAAAAVLKINAQLEWPITAANTSGALTLTAKQNGPRGNDIKVQANIISNQGAPGMTLDSATASTALTGGTTADSNTTALATALAQRHRYIVPAANDATQLGAVKTQVNTQALPATGNTQVIIAGYSGTVGNATTLATGLNAARVELAWQKSSDLTPAELAGAWAGCIARFEAAKRPRPRHNFNGFGNSEDTGAAWTIPAPRSGAAPTPAEVESALHNGITPIGANQNGTSYVVKRITTRSLNGSTADYRIRDAHKVAILDFWADKARTRIATAYDGKDIGDDPPPNTAPDPDVVTRSQFRSLLQDLIQEDADNGQIDRAAVKRVKEGVTVLRASSPSTRLTARVPFETIDILDSTATAVDQVR
jgi:phage tail sheath gpL-like